MFVPTSATVEFTCDIPVDVMAMLIADDVEFQQKMVLEDDKYSRKH